MLRERKISHLSLLVMSFVLMLVVASTSTVVMVAVSYHVHAYQNLPILSALFP